MDELTQRTSRLTLIALILCIQLIALFMAFSAGSMWAQRAEAAWIVERAHKLEVQAAADAASARALLQGVQAEKQTFVTSKADAGQVSSL